MGVLPDMAAKSMLIDLGVLSVPPPPPQAVNAATLAAAMAVRM
jgi:hypothetical protein